MRKVKGRCAGEKEGKKTYIQITKYRLTQERDAA